MQNSCLFFGHSFLKMPTQERSRVVHVHPVDGSEQMESCCQPREYPSGHYSVMKRVTLGSARRTLQLQPRPLFL